jgi:multidrug efflux pump subunit AcrB
MPPGTVPPFVVRFDGGSVPVGYLVFSSNTRALGEIQDLALNRIRPIFGTVPGVSAPPPFGGNQRTVVVRVDPDRLRAYRMSGEEIVRSLSRGNVVTPSGNVRIGDFTEMVPVNSVVRNVQELLDIPVRVGSGPSVFLRDVGYVEDTSDILTSYALINGKRSVYIPVTKRADASTLTVVQRVTADLPRMRAAIPEDIGIDFSFDQSGYVTNAIRSLATEGALGAFLTGLMVLLFLRHVRSSIIVILTIPLALLAAVAALWAAGQTISTDVLQETLRARIDEIAPGAAVSFEAADLVNQVMSFGSPTPIEVAVTGADLTASRAYAEELKSELAKVPALRDLQFGLLGRPR